MIDLNFDIFKGKQFSQLCNDIYDNSVHKKEQIDILIDDLRKLIKTPGDAIVIVPLLKEYFDISIKNDEHLIKLAAVVQRFMAKKDEKNADGDQVAALISDEEREQLLSEVSNVIKEMSENSIPKIDIPKENLNGI